MITEYSSRIHPTMYNSTPSLCVQPYYNHPKGCPNFNKKIDCPPEALPLNWVISFYRPIWIVWNIFDLQTHVKKLRLAHPKWSKRQLECCLYWQPKARRQLDLKILHIIHNIKERPQNLAIVKKPEAHGVDVTKTMKRLGELLEWPPATKTYQVALIGLKVRRRK